LGRRALLRLRDLAFTERFRMVACEVGEGRGLFAQLAL